MFYAARNGFTEVIKLLIDHEADLNFQNVAGKFINLKKKNYNVLFNYTKEGGSVIRYIIILVISLCKVGHGGKSPYFHLFK